MNFERTNTKISLLEDYYSHFDEDKRLKSRHGQVEFITSMKYIEEFEKKFFANPFAGFFETPAFAEFKTDVADEGDHYLLEADLPGFEKKDIRLDVNGDVLRVHAERHSRFEEKDKENKVVRMERSFGSYNREFDISGIKAEEIKAKYENGVLKLVLPKKEQVLPESRTLEIE